MKREQKQLKTKLSIIFWVNLITLFAIGIGLLYLVGVSGKSTNEHDFAMERFGIIIAIIVIPLSLKMFYDKYKKAKEEEIELFLRKLQTLFTLRMLALDGVIILNFIGFYFIGALNFIYMSGFTLLAFAFCYPTESVMDPEEKKIETEENL